MLAGSIGFSTIDLKSEYWQVEVHSADGEKRVLSALTGLWQINVIPFGLCNAPAT